MNGGKKDCKILFFFTAVHALQTLGKYAAYICNNLYNIEEN